MEPQQALAVMAGTWGVAMAIAPVLQLRTIIRHRTSAGLSRGYLAILVVGFGLWLAYGLSTGDAPIVVANILSLLVSGTTLIVAWWFRPGGPASSREIDGVQDGSNAQELEPPGPTISSAVALDATIR